MTRSRMTVASGSSQPAPSAASRSRPFPVTLLAAFAMGAGGLWILNGLWHLLWVAGFEQARWWVPILLPYRRREMGIAKFAAFPLEGLPLLVASLGVGIVLVLVGARLWGLRRGAWAMFLLAFWLAPALYLLPLVLAPVYRILLAMGLATLREQGRFGLVVGLAGTAAIVAAGLLVASTVYLIRRRSLFVS